MNLSHQGECIWQTVATENRQQRQLNVNNLLIPKTSVANVEYQDQRKEAQHPALEIIPATLLPPASNLGPVDMDQSPP